MVLHTIAATIAAIVAAVVAANLSQLQSRRSCLLMFVMPIYNKRN